MRRATPRETVIRDAIVSGEPYVGSDLSQQLQPFGPPALYLDFEAMMPPIPLHEGTRPYQTIPFQWVAPPGGRRRRHLSQGISCGWRRRPPRQFAETLIDALSSSNLPIIVYSTYEQTRLRELAVQFPDLAEALAAIIARLADLLPIVRSSVYLPEFGFSNSIKSVGPALCLDFTYQDLDGVADGAAASTAFLQIASGAISIADKVVDLRSQLLAYCEHDTLAMVKAHAGLKHLAAGSHRPDE